MQTKKTKRPKGLIRRFIPYFAKYKAVLFFDLFCAALNTVCELVLPMLVRYVTNAGINDLASLTVGVVLKIGALYLFLRLVDAAANFFMASGGHIMGTKIETDMRTAMFDHLQKLSFNYFDNTKVAQIMTRITTDLFDVTKERGKFTVTVPDTYAMAEILRLRYNGDVQLDKALKDYDYFLLTVTMADSIVSMTFKTANYAIALTPPEIAF